MKKIITFHLLTAYFCSALTTPQGDAEKKIFFDECEGRIAEAAKQLPNEGFATLSHLLQGFGDKVSKNPSPEDRWARCYGLAQSAMLAIPGHAKFVQDKHENDAYYSKTFDRRMIVWGIQTLAYLPSPETIQVLGGYLEDFRESPTPNLPLDEQVISATYTPITDYVIRGYIPWQATCAIATIGLRDAPLANIRLGDLPFDPESKNQWKKTRAWYQEVKAGKRTFSFRGQPVEYRFHADGTWETIALKNPPDDEVTYPIRTGTSALDLPAATLVKEKPASSNSSVWQWAVGMLCVALAGVACWLPQRRWRKKITGDDRP